LDVRVRDADVDDSAHAGLPGGVEQDERVRDRLCVREQLVIEAHPVSIDQNLLAFQRLGEQLGTVKIERRDADSSTERVFPVH
jgi:hypothetical protein